MPLVVSNRGFFVFGASTVQRGELTFRRGGFPCGAFLLISGPCAARTPYIEEAQGDGVVEARQVPL